MQCTFRSRKHSPIKGSKILTARVPFQIKRFGYGVKGGLYKKVTAGGCFELINNTGLRRPGGKLYDHHAFCIVRVIFNPEQLAFSRYPAEGNQGLAMGERISAVCLFQFDPE